MENGRILVVEDDLIVAEDLKNQLLRLGYSVPGLATRGDEAVSRVVDVQPDLVMMDIHLEGELDGIEAAQQIRASSEVPIVFLTARADGRTLRRALQVEPSGYLVKPLKPEELGAVVARALKRRKLQRQLRASEAQFRAMFEAAPTATVLADAQGRIILVNARAEEMFGYHRDELLGQAVEVLLPKSLRQAHVAHRVDFWAAPATRPMGIGLDLVGRRRDGTEFPVEIGLGSVEMAEGRVVISSISDITERKRAEEMLRLKDSALDSSINAIAMADLEGNLTYVNDSFLRIWGYQSQAEVLERPAVQFWQDQEKAVEVIQALFAQGRWLGELTALRSDGSLFHAQLSANLVTDGQDRPIQMLASFVDVTARKKAESGVRSLSRFPSENPTPVLRIDRSGLVLYANRSSAPLLEKWDTQVDGRLPAAWRQFVTKVFETGESQDVEVRCGERVFSLAFAPVLEEGYVNVYGLDTTDRKRAEEELRKLSRAVDQSPSTVVITDTQGNIEYVNPKFSQLTGYTAEEAIGQTPRILKSDVHSDEMYAILWETITSGREWRGEFANCKKDGELYWELASISPVRNVEGEITYFVKVGEDITERKQAEEALRAYTQELQARNEELDAFAHTVAHDLQNPLNLIIGFGDLLAEELADLQDKELKKALHYVVRNSRKMSNIINELLLLSSVRTIDVALEPLSMADVVAEALKRLDEVIAQSQAEVIVPEAWPTAWGHAPWLEEVWANYISNAIKYGGSPPRVELGAEGQAGGMVRFWVRDNGAGLTPEQQAQLFVPFTRLAQVRVSGHGLGLSIVRRIVEKLGGEVAVESEGLPGKGCTFSFTLPGQRGA